MKRNAMKFKSGLLIALALVAVQLYSQPNWQVNPADFQYTMTVTGKGYFNCLLSTNPANQVGAFVNGECRGYASFNTPVNGSNFAFLTIYSNVAQGSAVTFKMYNATSNTIVDCPVGITFNEGQIVGNDVQPYAFKTEYLLESLNLPNTSLFDYTTAGTAISQPTLLNELGQIVPGTFSFVNDAQGPDNGSFSITPAGLVINQNVNFITQDTFRVHLSGVSAGGCVFDSAFVLPVVNTNIPPQGLLVDTLSVNENEFVATLVGQLQADDPSVGDAHIFTFMPSMLPSADYASFTLQGANLLTAVELNYEAQSYYHLAVKVQDQTGSIAYDTLVVQVLDVPDLSALLVDTMSIIENATLATVVGILQPNFVSANNSYTYTHLPSNDFAAFNLAVDQVSSATEINYETQSTYHLAFQIDDVFGNTVIDTLVIQVIDVEEMTGLLEDTFSISENIPLASFVAQLQPNFTNAGVNYSYSYLPAALPSNDYAAFALTADQISTAALINFETQDFYHLAIQLQDDLGNTIIDTLVVEVIDVQDISALLVDTMSITENATLSTVVGILQPNFVSTNNSYTYTHLPSADFAAFNLNVDQISSAVSINYETQDWYHLAIQIDDAYGNSVIDTLVIQVIDVEEMTGLLEDTFSISENLPLASFVGQLQPNFTNAGVNYTYSYLPAALPSNDYAAFALTADQLSTAAIIDFETQDFYHLAIQLQDDLGNTIVDTLVVEVLDVLDLSALLVDTMSITENASLATLVGTLQPNFVTDNNSYTYTHLPSADFAAFSLTVDQVSSASAINYETQAWYHLAIQIDDAYGNSAIDTLVVQVIDVEEMTGLLVDTFTINENIPVTTFVGQLQPNFVNVGAAYTYSYMPAVLPSNDYAAFTLATDQVTTAALINFEGQNVYHMAVQLSDDLGNNILDTLVVQVLNIPDVTSLLVDSLTINENTALASLVIALQPDYVSANNSFTYSYAPAALPSNDYTAFSLTADQLTVAAQINFEAQAWYHLAIQIDDVFGNTVFDTLVIQVLDLPEMTGLLVDSLSIDENVSLSTLVGLLQPNFVNEGIAYTYSFDETSLPSADYAAFGIADDQLETAAELNYEQQVWYYLAVQIDDELGNVIHDTLVVRVLDVIELDDLKAGNLLTPDADGHNDTFSIPSIELYANYVLHVYNAIGNLVYEAKQYDNSWTGLTSSGTELPSGTYYYVFQDSTNADRSFKGQLHIYRPNKF